MNFMKQDMAYSHYSWNDDKTGNKAFSGEPSRRLFNRFNGDQVLFIIKCYASISDKFTVETGRMIEDQISRQLPLEPQSEITVFNWICNNFHAEATQ